MGENKAFKVLIVIYIFLFVSICVYGAIVPSKGNSIERGSSIYFPKEDSVVSQTFNVNGSVYAKSGVKSASLIVEGNNTTYNIGITQETIEHDGKVLEVLSTFKNQVTLEDGTYHIHIEITEVDGNTYSFTPRTITVDKDAKVSSFQMFSLQHIVTLLIITAVFVFIFVFFKNRKKSHIILAYICSLLVIACDVVSRSWLVANGTFRASFDMALHMCDISGVLVPIFLFMKPGKGKENLYNLMFIWGLGGALMAILTPEMGGYAFPSYYYFNFFIKHSMIIFAVLIATIFNGMRPNIRRLGWVMIVSTIIVIAIYGIDQLIRLIPPYEPGNYMFLSYPPTGGSLIDMLVMIFGPSPYYIIGLEILGALIYVILWLPFYVGEKIIKKRIGESI